MFRATIKTAIKPVSVRHYLLFLFSVLLLCAELALANSTLPAQAAESKNQVVEFSAEEKEWISAHPAITIGVDYDFVPFEFVDNDGQHKGICADYLAVISNKTGISMNMHPEPNWAAVIEKTRAREIDVLPCVGMTEERKTFMNYSTPVQSFYRVVVTQKGADIGNKLDDMYRFRVAVQENSSHHGFLKDNSTIQPVLFDTVEQAIIALSNNEVDIVIGNENTSTYIINTNSIINLKMERLAGAKEKHLYIAMRKDWPVFQGIVNKVLDSISQDERVAIKHKWLAVKPEKRFDYMLVYQILAGILLVVFLAVIWGLHIRRQHHHILGVARRDQLTGLYNRHYLYETANKLIARARKNGDYLSLIMLDVDHFKAFNDKYGHLAGDRVLSTVASELLSHCRKGDDVFRYGGEEFMILLSGANLFQAEAKAELIRATIEQLQTFKTQITCSFGVAQLGTDEKSMEELIQRADEALYQAKAEGRNRVISSQLDEAEEQTENATQA